LRTGLLKALRDKKIAGSNPGAYEEDSGNRQILNYIYFSIIKRVFTRLKRRGENPAPVKGKMRLGEGSYWNFLCQSLDTSAKAKSGMHATSTINNATLSSALLHHRFSVFISF